MSVSIKTTERLFGTAEAAEYLGLKTDTVRQYVLRGILHPRKERVGRNYLFDESELKRYNREKRDPGNPNFTSQE